MQGLIAHYYLSQRVLQCAKRLGSALVLVAAVTAHAQTASFQGLGDLPGGVFASEAAGINADGTVAVGTANGPLGETAVRWVNGVIQALPVLPGYSSSVGIQVSGDGSTIVGWSGTASVNSQACVWVNGVVTGLGQLPGYSLGTVGYCMSRDGSVLSGYAWESGIGGRAFRYTNGALAPLTVPSGAMTFGRDVSGNGLVIGGASGIDPAESAVVWNNAGQPTFHPDLAGGINRAQIEGLNYDGSIRVGFGNSALNPSGVGEACMWIGNLPPFSLGDLPGGAYSSYARQVSDDGGVAVGFGTTGVGPDPTGREAMVWTPADGMRNVRQVLVDTYGLNLTGWSLTVAFDVSPDGRVLVGRGFNPSGQQEAWIATVPCWSKPTIDQHPVDTLVGAGCTASFSVKTRTSGATSYSWRKGGVPLVDGPTGTGSTVVGAATPDLQIQNVSTLDAGNYDCVISNPCGSIASSPAALIDCYANCDCSIGGEPLSIDDFICFQTSFALADPTADCDGDGALSIDDFICFQTYFAIGC